LIYQKSHLKIDYIVECLADSRYEQKYFTTQGQPSHTYGTISAPSHSKAEALKIRVNI
jgi:hypothetical protein